MEPEESTAWYEAGLSSDGTELGEWEREAIIRYGRYLIKDRRKQLETLAVTAAKAMDRNVSLRLELREIKETLIAVGHFLSEIQDRHELSEDEKMQLFVLRKKL